MPNSRYSFIFILLLIISGGWSLSAQNQNSNIRPKENSPYSRIALGNYFSQYLAAANGMAGLSAAYHDPFHLNILNPASLPHLRATAFEVGVYAKYAQLQSPEASDDIWSGNLSYLALGFPLKNRVNEALDRVQSDWDFGMSFALVPYTQVGYDVLLEDRNDEFKLATNQLKGDGGTYRFQWGNALQYKGFSVGATIQYNFGKLIRNRRVDFDSLDHALSTEFLDELSVSGFTWNAGVMYTHNFMERDDDGELVPSGRRLVFGAYGHSSRSINTTSSSLYTRSNFVSYLPSVVIDTLVEEEGFRQKMRLPGEFSLGATYEVANKFKLGIEYSLGQWSQYENPAKPERLLNNSRLAVGFEYIPDVGAYNNYLKRMYYRAGLFTGSDPRSANGEQLKQTGITLGVGLPIIMPRQQVSFFDLSLELGRFGVSDALRENYAKLTLGFTLNDNSWFFKRKFN